MTEADVMERSDEVDDDFEGMVDEAGQPLTHPAAERALLGAMLLDPECIERVAHEFSADNLADHLHRRIFEKLAQLYEIGAEIKPKPIVEALGGDPNAKLFRDMTVAQYIASLLVNADPETDPLDVARVLMDIAERRATSTDRDIDLIQEPFKSRFGLVMYADQNQPGPEYEYHVEDLIPKGEGVLLMGETQTGKSFLTQHLALCGARGIPFFGRRILQPFGTIWCAYEAARGQTARMRAYRKFHNLELEDLPFAVLTKPLALWPNPDAASALIQEMRLIVKNFFHGAPLGLVVFDTYNAATPGASEIDSQVVSQIRQQFDRFREELPGTSTIIVGHTNAIGKHRGNEQLTNNIDTVIVVSRKMRAVSSKDKIEDLDEAGRPVRVMKVKKQREGQDGEEHEFVLRVVEDGTKNAFGRMRTSCVVTEPTYTEPPSGDKPSERKDDGSIGVRVPAQTKIFLECVLETVRDYGVPPPPELNLPRSISKVADWTMVKRLFGKKSMSDEVDAGDKELKTDTLKKSLTRARERLLALQVIGNDSPTNVIWWTGKPVHGMRETQPKRRELFDNEPTHDEFFADDPLRPGEEFR